MRGSREADARADSKFHDALVYNQRDDNYTVLTIGFAAVLFFAAIGSRFKGQRAQWILLGVGIAGFVVFSAFLISFPKMI